MSLENYDRRQDTNFDMRALCIGAPHDGEWHTVPAHLKATATMMISERPTLRAVDWNPNDPIVATSTLRQTPYTVFVFVTEYRAYKLLVHPSMTCDAAFNTLMRCYGGQR